MVQTIAPYVHACPGPGLAVQGLRLAAFQELASTAERASPMGKDRPRYHRSMKDVAEAIRCRPDYLRYRANKMGYSYARAIRWVTFLHGMTLRSAGLEWVRIARLLGFNDAAGWNRFTRRLLGRTPAQLPRVPLDFWVMEAIRDVFLKPLSHDEQVRRAG